MLKDVAAASAGGHCCMALVLAALGIYSFVASLDFTDVAQGYYGPLMSKETLEELNNASRVAEYRGGAQRLADAADERLVFLLYDGMGWESFTTLPGMEQVINDPRVKADGTIRRMRTQQPSISLPNWLSYLTSSAPEFHGQWGNDNPQHPLVDTFFRQAAVADLERAVVGTEEWWKFHYQFMQPLRGDGTYPYNRVPRSAPPDALADERDQPLYANDRYGRGLLYEAVQASSPSFTLVNSYFENLDSQGHRHGAASVEYAAELNYTASVIRGVIDRLDEHTTFVVVSDHGHYSQGGHGGAHTSIRHVPMLVYRKGSGMGSATMPAYLSDAQFPLSSTADEADGTEADPDQPEDASIRQLTSLDVGPTISALLGIPVPRSSFGEFVTDVLSLAPATTLNAAYHDMYVQKVRFARAYAREFGEEACVPGSESDTPSFKLPPSLRDEDGGVTTTSEPVVIGVGAPNADDLKFYRDEIVALDKQIIDARNALWRSRTTGNAFAAFFISVAILALWFLLLACWGFGFQGLVCTRCRGDGRRNGRNLLYWHAITTSIGAVLTLAKYGVGIGVFFLFYVAGTWRPMGDDWRWDYTMFNTSLDGWNMGE